MAFTIKRNDTLPVYHAQLTASSPTDPTIQVPVDLTGASVRFLMKQGTTLKVTAAATLVDAPTGKVKYTWVPGDTDTSGAYQVEFEVTWANGVQTFPSDTYETITIKDDLG